MRAKDVREFLRRHVSPTPIHLPLSGMPPRRWSPSPEDIRAILKDSGVTVSVDGQPSRTVELWTEMLTYCRAVITPTPVVFGT